MAGHTVGDPVPVRFYRKGQVSTVTLATSSVPADAGSTLRAAVIGVQLVPQGGMLVVSRATPNGTWTQARLKPGDAIVAVDGRPVRAVDEFDTALVRARGQHRGSILVTVRRGQYQGHVPIAL